MFPINDKDYDTIFLFVTPQFCNEPNMYFTLLITYEISIRGARYMENQSSSCINARDIHFAKDSKNCNKWCSMCRTFTLCMSIFLDQMEPCCHKWKTFRPFTGFSINESLLEQENKKRMAIEQRIMRRLLQICVNVSFSLS